MIILRPWMLFPWLSLAACGPSLFPIPETKVGEAPQEVSPFVREGFVALGQKDGVTIYRREQRPGMELAAEGDFQASPERVLKVLSDYPNHKSWQEHLAEVRVLDRGDGFLDVYERLSLPVVDDRDFTLHVSWSKESGAISLHFATISDKGPPPAEGVVRVTDHDGGWILTPLNDGHATHAAYHFHLDLGGDIPSWLGKDKAAGDLVALFANIRRELPHYPS